jgi:nucleoside phosphorylase
MAKEILIITALSCEAAPLIKAYEARPLRENPCAERFQVFYGNGAYIATSGIGKIRSAIATSALMTSLFPELYRGGESPLVANIGIAGYSSPELPIGTLTYINKVHDVATDARFYPDIIVRHGLVESSLETYDHPVRTPPKHPVCVDMEGAGMIQAALTITMPSSVCLLKVISDHCLGTRLSQDEVSALVAKNSERITTCLGSIKDALPQINRINTDEHSLIVSACENLKFSLSQRTEIYRRVQTLHSQGLDWKSTITPLLQLKVGVKEERNKAYHQLLVELTREISL